MAELDVGKQCSISFCKQLENSFFLQISYLFNTCSDCCAIFCLEHRSTTSHNCIGKLQGEKTENQVSIADKSPSSMKCLFQDCNARELLPVKCEFCQGMFCLRHRHQQDHLCPKQETTSVNSLAAKYKKLQVPITKKEKIGRGGVKCSSRAAKVALMKMKLHAFGESSTPQVERVYFSISLPIESSESSKPMFFSKKWTVGRVIDQIAKVCKLKNQNNQQLSKKLRLFHGLSEKQLILGNTLETEMNENQETLINGCELVLKYVEEG